MPVTLRDADTIEGFHAHIYYEPDTRPLAAELRAGIEARFAMRMGRWHDQPVGPHTQAMYQIAFATGEFPRIVPWLMLNHGPLSVLIHPNTGDGPADHTRHALWLGQRLEVNLAAFADD